MLSARFGRRAWVRCSSRQPPSLMLSHWGLGLGESGVFPHTQYIAGLRSHGGCWGSGFLRPEPQNSHRKRTAAVSTASAGPVQGMARLFMPPGSGAPCADPQSDGGDSLPDTSMHMSHPHHPQGHSDLGNRKDPRRQQREHRQERSVCRWGQKGNQSLCPDSGGMAPQSATKGISIFSVGVRPALSAQTHILDPFLGEGPLLTDTQRPHIG